MLGGHRKLLLGNSHGAVRIYNNSHQNSSTRHYCTLQIKLISQSRWMDLHENHTRNVRITTSRNPFKQLTHTLFSQTWILTSQTHIRIMATCVDNYFFHIGSGRFWNWICWTVERISFDDCTEDVLWEDHNVLGVKVVLWYNSEMELYKKVCRHINSGICKGIFTPIWS